MYNLVTSESRQPHASIDLTGDSLGGHLQLNDGCLCPDQSALAPQDDRDLLDQAQFEHAYRSELRL